ncbi:hypothetical protein BDD12DRAFT_728888 [Trichophaea hybrida]|nr:hypothetical protein BDD12DRAFT_728888 [Trichophaea hybrida]
MAACSCQRVSNPGLYCGYCGDGVITTVDNDHVAWCNRAGGCEDLGWRRSCAQQAGPCDGRDSGCK